MSIKTGLALWPAELLKTACESFYGNAVPDLA
jgi:hypothetical protein